ncbi:MAG: YbjQ family protein [Bacillota bacterium]
MQVFTINYVPGREIEALGLVTGNVVQAKHIGRDLMAGLKNIAGGEIKSYTDLLNESRVIARDRMIAEAEKLGADAIISMRFGTASIMEGTSEILAYGTAVKVK